MDPDAAAARALQSILAAAFPDHQQQPQYQTNDAVASQLGGFDGLQTPSTSGQSNSDFLNLGLGPPPTQHASIQPLQATLNPSPYSHTWELFSNTPALLPGLSFPPPSPSVPALPPAGARAGTRSRTRSGRVTQATPGSVASQSRISSSTYQPQPTRSGRVPQPPEPSRPGKGKGKQKEADRETLLFNDYFDWPSSDDEENDPDFHPQSEANTPWGEGDILVGEPEGEDDESDLSGWEDGLGMTPGDELVGETPLAFGEVGDLLVETGQTIVDPSLGGGQVVGNVSTGAGQGQAQGVVAAGTVANAPPVKRARKGKGKAAAAEPPALAPMPEAPADREPAPPKPPPKKRARTAKEPAAKDPAAKKAPRARRTAQPAAPPPQPPQPPPPSTPPHPRSSVTFQNVPPDSATSSAFPAPSIADSSDEEAERPHSDHELAPPSPRRQGGPGPGKRFTKEELMARRREQNRRTALKKKQRDAYDKQESDKRIRALEEENGALRERVTELERRLQGMQQAVVAGGAGRSRKRGREGETEDETWGDGEDDPDFVAREEESESSEESDDDGLVPEDGLATSPPGMGAGAGGGLDLAGITPEGFAELAKLLQSVVKQAA